MSIKVMTWVWANSYEKGSALLLLLAIADHAHDDGTGAFPSIETLAQKIRMSVRNTKYLLLRLQKNESLQIASKGSPSGTNAYCIPLVVQTLHSANQRTPIVQTSVGDSAIAIAPPIPYEPYEPSNNRQCVCIGDSGDSDKKDWPDWYATLHAIPGFKTPLKDARAWLDLKNYPLDLAETTAYALKGKWPGPTKSPYRDPWATFQAWLRREAEGRRRPDGKSSQSINTQEDPFASIRERLERQRVGSSAGGGGAPDGASQAPNGLPPVQPAKPTVALPE